MIECMEAAVGQAWRVTVAMTQAHAATLLVSGQRLLLADQHAAPVAIDLSSVSEADSSGLAVLLDWLRTARQQGREMRVEGLPAGLRALAELYGIDEILGLSLAH